MNESMFDHVFFLLMSVVVPVIVYRAANKPGGEPLPRVRNYLRNVVPWSLPPALLIYKWLDKDRELTELGLGPPETGIAALVILALLVAGWGVLLTRQWPAWRKALLEPALQRGGLHTPPMPQSRSEIPAFLLLDAAETASDELVYRGFVLYYLLQFIPLAAGIALMTLIYVGSEAYRGRHGMVRAGVLALTNGLLLAGTGSLWAGIAVQAGWRAARLLGVLGALNRQAETESASPIVTEE